MRCGGWDGGGGWQARDRKTSLLMFLVQELLKKQKEIKFLNTELKAVAPASKLSLEALKSAQGELRKGLKQVRNN